MQEILDLPLEEFSGWGELNELHIEEQPKRTPKTPAAGAARPRTGVGGKLRRMPDGSAVVESSEDG